MPLNVGTIVPDFTLASTSGEDFILSKDANEKMCILYVYPEDFSPICTAQACAFRDTFDYFNGLGIDVYGISPDSIATHLRFKEENKLQFELLSDPDGSVIKQLGVFTPLGNITKMLNFTKRVTFLLNKEHKVISVYQNSFFPKKHITTLIENIKKLEAS